jgi:hypothetical protein
VKLCIDTLHCEDFILKSFVIAMQNAATKFGDSIRDHDSQVNHS